MRKKLILAMAGAMLFASAFADTQTVDGVTWTYSVANGEATVGSGTVNVAAIPQTTSGALTVPAMLGGCPVTSIGAHAFDRCSSLTSVVIPTGVVKINAFAFNDCRSLESVILPEGLEYIGYVNVFCGCVSLKSITIPSTVTMIDDLSFQSCSALKSVTIPAAVTRLGDGVFAGCTSLEEIRLDGNTNFTIRAGLLCSRDGKTVLQCPGALASVAIPDDVTHLGDCSFDRCPNLREIILPPALESIGWGAIDSCPISTLHIPANVSEIDSYQFCGCDSLMDFTVDSTNQNFSAVNGLLCDKSGTEIVHCPRGAKEITIPRQIESVREGAFDYCYDLVVRVEAGDRERVRQMIGEDGEDFVYLEPGEMVPGEASSEFVNGYTWTFDVVDDEAWITGCAEEPIGRLDIPGELGGCPVVAIGESLFDNDYRSTPYFESVTIPASVRFIADYAFYACPALKYVVYEGDEAEIEFGYSVFFGTPYENGWYSPVLKIEGGVIVGYSYVEGEGGCVTNGVLVIPAGVTSIGESALASMEEVEAVVIPASVKSIGGYAFGWCANLGKVTFADRAGCAVSESAFVGTPWQLAQKLTFGPGKISTFTIGGGVCSLMTERAVIAGVAGVTWEDFVEIAYKGNGYGEVDTYQCLTCDGIVDVEKTEEEDADDYSCWELPKINMAYWGGYVSKTVYPTEDAVADAYRANGCMNEVFSWLGVPTNRVDWGTYDWGAADINEFIVRHLKDGNALVELTTWESSHGVTCCGYVCDESRELWEPGYLTGLFIIDSDNDMYVNGGGAGAPNRIAYCPVEWDGEEYLIGNVWGLEWDGFDVHCALWAKGAPVAPKIAIPFDFEMRDSAVTGFHGDLPSNIVIPRGATSVGVSAFDADYHDVHSLVSAALPEGVTYIDQYAFWGCENLTTLALPASLESMADQSFSWCTALRTVYVAQGDADRIRDMLSEAAFGKYSGERVCTIDVSKITFVEGEHPDLTVARLGWAKDDAVAEIEDAANEVAGGPSGWNAALKTLVNDVEAAVYAATTIPSAEAAGKAGAERVRAFLENASCTMRGKIANFGLYEDVSVEFRRITAVGHTVWSEIAEDGTYEAELSAGDWQVTVLATRVSDGAEYTTTESVSVSGREAELDIELPTDEYLGNAIVDTDEAGKFWDVGVGGLADVARKTAATEERTVAFELKVTDPELYEESAENPVLLLAAAPTPAALDAAPVSSTRETLERLRAAALAADADDRSRIDFLKLSLARSDDGGDTWSQVDSLKDDTVEVTIPLEFDEKMDFTILRSDGGEIDRVRQILDNDPSVPPATGADEGFRVEPGKVVLQVSRFAVFAIVSAAPRGRLYPDGDGAFAVPTAAVSYEGVVLRDGAVAGTLTAKVSKPNAKKGSVADITLKVKTINKATLQFKAKKLPLPGTGGRFALEPANSKSAAFGATSVVISGDSLMGSFANGFEIDAVRDVFKTKGDPKRSRVQRYVQGGRSWCVALGADAPGLGYAAIGVKVAANGKVKVKGHMGDGVKVSASATAEIGQGWLAVPVMVNKKSGGALKTFGFRVSLDEASGKVGVANATDYAGVEFSVVASGLPELTKAVVQAATVEVFAGNALPSRPDKVKLSYKDKTGEIGGTVTWQNVAGKKKLSGKVYGVVVGNQGFGEIVVKGVGSFKFMLVLR